MGWVGEGEEVFEGRSHGLGGWLSGSRNVDSDGLALFRFMLWAAHLDC